MKTQIKKHQMFILNNEIYGVPMERVNGIRSVDEVAKSVLSLKGKVLPIIDLRAKLKYAQKDYDEKTSVITVEVETCSVLGTCGMIVDAIADVWEIDSKEICEPLPYGTYIEREFLSGMGIVKGEVIALLDVDKVISKDELEEIQTLRISKKIEKKADVTSVGDQQWMSIAETLWSSKTSVMIDSIHC